MEKFSGGEKKALRRSIVVVEKVDEPALHPGISTLEGSVGSLLNGTFLNVYYLELSPDAYLPEYGHDAENILYTVRGSWVLCTEGRRRIIDPGTLCRIGAGVSVGYEVPFDAAVVILVFKSSTGTDDEEMLIDFYAELLFRSKKLQSNGSARKISKLPADHPARIFTAGMDSVRLYEQYCKN